MTEGIDLKLYNSFYTFRNFTPEVAPSAFVAPGARVVGRVSLAADSSIWFNAVLRADIAAITIGEGSNIQDNCVLHAGRDKPCIIGNGVVVGHGALLEACTVGDGCLIGMGAVLLSGASIGAGSVIAAGAVVKEGMLVKAGCLYAGNPARLVKAVSPEQGERVAAGAAFYVNLAREYRGRLIG